MNEQGQQRNRLLILIAAYKLVQALLFAAVGIGAVRLLHKDIGDVLSDLVQNLRFNPESHLVNFILDKASVLNDPLLRRIGAAAFSYAGVSLVESIGLLHEKAWAEYLTLLITGSFLPLELFEIFRHVTPVRVALFVINLLVFLYLLRVVSTRRSQLAATAAH